MPPISQNGRGVTQKNWGDLFRGSRGFLLTREAPAYGRGQRLHEGLIPVAVLHVRSSENDQAGLEFLDVGQKRHLRAPSVQELCRINLQPLDLSNL